MQEQVLKCAKSLLQFINDGPSPYHVASNCKKMLRAAGFVELDEKKQWSITTGGKYFVTRNQSSVFAFAVGEKYTSGNGYTVIGAHTDSPCFQVKPRSKLEKSGGCLSVGVQCYGGGIWSTWFDRDLTVAGRVLVKKDDKVVHRLVHIDRPILRIPHLCIHLQREMNDKLVINKETHTAPIIATKEFDEMLNRASDSGEKSGGKHHSVFINVLCEELGCKPEDLLDFDLCLADTQPAAIGGVYNEFIYAPRLDNLFNSYCSLEALIQSVKETTDLAEEKNIRMVALYDNEEVGSESAQGAGSMITEHLMRRVCASLNSSFEQAMSNSYVLSADQAHGVHPNYPEKHEDNHKPTFHGGPVIKFNANQRYASTALTASVFRMIAAECKVPLQEVVVRNDSTCGSTIGPILSAKLGVQTLDIGGPQLAMHSIREMAGTKGVLQCLTLFEQFFKSLPNVSAKITAE